MAEPNPEGLPAAATADAAVAAPTAPAPETLAASAPESVAVSSPAAAARAPESPEAPAAGSATGSTSFPALASIVDIDDLRIDNLKSALADRNLATTGDIHGMRKRLRAFIERQASSSEPQAPAAAGAAASASGASDDEDMVVDEIIAVVVEEGSEGNDDDDDDDDDDEEEEEDDASDAASSTGLAGKKRKASDADSSVGSAGTNETGDQMSKKKSSGGSGGAFTVESGSHQGEKVPTLRQLTIPFRNTKRTMKLNVDPSMIVQQEAAMVTTYAMELFLARFAHESLQNAKKKNRSTIRYEDVAEARTMDRNKNFLDYLIP